MSLVIKKRVSLEFLGDEYKDGEIVFKSIPAKDLPEIISKSEAAGEDSKLLIPVFIDVLQSYFIDGGVGDDKIAKEDIGELDADSVIHCFQILTGQAIDPKANGQSTTTSKTEAPEAQK